LSNTNSSTSVTKNLNLTLLFLCVLCGSLKVPNGLVTLILFLTLVFANLAAAVAQGRGKAQADARISTKADTTARQLLPDGSIQEVSSTSLRRGDQITAIAGDVIPSDGEVIAGSVIRRTTSILTI
jgi:high-affinity K+ transport system ATPase subunit B